MKLDRNYIKEQLVKIGLRKGDTVLVHSQLLKVGLPEEDVFDLGKYYLDIILDIIGEKGELVLPAFTYSYCNKKEFSPLEDMSSVSELANSCIRNHIGYRTQDPLFSYVLVNPRSEEQSFSNVCFDFDNGMAGYLSFRKAKYLMIGDQIFFTLWHACEQQLRTHNRFMKKFSGTTKINGSKIHSEYYFYFSLPFFPVRINVDIVLTFRVNHREEITVFHSVKSNEFIRLFLAIILEVIHQFIESNVLCNFISIDFNYQFSFHFVSPYIKRLPRLLWHSQ